MHPRAHTKIVATIGPASDERIGDLIRAGMSVARINLSHGSEEEHRGRVERLRAAAHAAQVPIGILFDLQGPKMRMGLFPGGAATLEEGETIRLREGSGMASAGEALLNLDGLLAAVHPGHRVILADGMVQLEARAIEGDAIVAEVVSGGVVGDRKGVHLPDSDIPYELPTDKDVEHLALATELGIDMVAVSFVARAEEVRRVRELAGGALVISKIERLAALENLPGLLTESDGIMVARGDLGVELRLERLPLVQKRVLEDALHAGRFTITATEMLESMVDKSRPTRAEVTDVANAVLDGTDAVMLSAETAIGAHPVEAVRTMTRIAREVETSRRYRERPRPEFRGAEVDFANATALAAVRAADALGIERIVAFTETGNTARLVSRYRPSAEIVALSPIERTVAQMTMLANVVPILFRREESLEEMLHFASEMLVVREMADYGDPIVFVAGVPAGTSRSTNVMKLHRIGEEIRLH